MVVDASAALSAAAITPLAAAKIAGPLSPPQPLTLPLPLSRPEPPPSSPSQPSPAVVTAAWEGVWGALPGGSQT